jgi:hypothetical protein
VYRGRDSVVLWRCHVRGRRGKASSVSSSLRVRNLSLYSHLDGEDAGVTVVCREIGDTQDRERGGSQRFDSQFSQM